MVNDRLWEFAGKVTGEMQQTQITTYAIIYYIYPSTTIVQFIYIYICIYRVRYSRQWVGLARIIRCEIYIEIYVYCKEYWYLY